MAIVEEVELIEAIPTLYNGTPELATAIPEELEFLMAFWWVFALLGIWALVWKGLALWKAAGNKSKGWFIALLLINTLGIMDIIYYFAAKKKY